MPDLIPTTRAMYMSSGAEWITFPNTTWSTCSRSTPARSRAASTAARPSSVGGTPLRLLPYEPTAVRAADEITTSVTGVLLRWLAKPGRLARATPVRRHTGAQGGAAEQQQGQRPAHEGSVRDPARGEVAELHSEQAGEGQQPHESHVCRPADARHRGVADRRQGHEQQHEIPEEPLAVGAAGEGEDRSHHRLKRGLRHADEAHEQAHDAGSGDQLVALALVPGKQGERSGQVADAEEYEQPAEPVHARAGDPVPEEEPGGDPGHAREEGLVGDSHDERRVGRHRRHAREDHELPERAALAEPEGLAQLLESERREQHAEHQEGGPPALDLAAATVAEPEAEQEDTGNAGHEQEREVGPVLADGAGLADVEDDRPDGEGHAAHDPEPLRALGRGGTRARRRSSGRGLHQRQRGFQRARTDRSATGQAVHRPTQGDRVDATAGVLAERHEPPDPGAEGAVAAGALASEASDAQTRMAEVAVHVAAVELAEAAVADHVAADDRAVATGVAVLENRSAMARGAPAPEPVPALEEAPAEVVAAARGMPAAARVADEVDLLDLVLTDVAHRQVPAPPVEREAPRVPQPVGIDLGPAAAAHERVAARDGVPAARARIEPQQLAEQPVAVLSVAIRVG